MGDITFDQISLGQRLEKAATAAGIVGAGLVVSSAQSQAEAYCGTYDQVHAVTADTRFHMGSITKMWTSAMLLADGADPEQFIVDALPDFQLHEACDVEALKLKHLMNHHAGFFADSYALSDGGENTGEAYVRGLRHSLPLAPVGRLHSYGNAYTSVLGRVLEKRTGKSYVRAFTDFVADLGLEETGTTPPPGPEEGYAAQYDLSGKAMEPDAKLVGLNPAGASSWSTVRDLNAFGRAFLAGGLLNAVFGAMRADLKRGPCTTFASWWGLGLMGYDQGQRVLGHHGVVPGQRAFLRLIPDAGICIALQCTGGDGLYFMEELLVPLIKELTDAQCDTHPTLDPVKEDVSPFIGTYAHQYASIRVFEADGALKMTIRSIHQHSVAMEETIDLIPKGDGLVAAQLSISRMPIYHRFIERLDGDGIGWFNFRGCLFPRVSST